MKKIIIHIDGGSRGNPGPSALGVLFSDEKGNILKKYSQFLGKKTNNEAEYEALIFALKKAKLLFGKKEIKNLDLEIKSDSELLIKQMNSEYKIKNPNIQQLFLLAWNLKIDFNKVRFFHIPREENQGADKLVNKALDIRLI